MRNINDTLVRNESISKETKEMLDSHLKETLENGFNKIDNTLINMNGSNSLIIKSINSLNEMNNSFKEVNNTLINVNNTSQESLINFEDKMNKINFS